MYGFKEKKRGINLSLTLYLLIFNIILFIVFTLLISKNILSIDSIAVNPSNILSGKYLWTLITSVFMHAGFFHLFANMVSLIFLGSFIEKLLGKKRYLSFYLASGVFAGLFFVLSGLLIKSDFNSYAVGASGALFGLIGLLMLLTPNLRVYLFFIPIPIKMKYAAPGILILLWVVSIAANISFGNFAHLGGFVFGLLYGLYLKIKFPRKTKYIQRTFI